MNRLSARHGALLIAAVWFGFSLTSCAGAGSAGSSQNAGKAFFSPGPSHDVVLEVTPLRVKAFEIGSAVDAIQGPPDKPYTVSAVILFRIERTLRGEFTVVHGATPSLFEQISDSVDEHSASSIVKLLTMNFERPGDPVQKGWVTVAVEDPEKTFGIGDWENPGDGRFRLSLNRAPQSADSYILADAQKI